MSGFVLRTGEDIWDNDTGIVLIPVNCEGVMGLGLAKDCKEKYPDVYKDYRALCKSGKFILGTMKLYLIRDDYAILLIPTKYKWRNASKLEWVERVLEKLGDCIPRSPMDSFHVPPIGWGAGGLNIDTVRPMVEKYLCHDNVTINFYQPN